MRNTRACDICCFDIPTLNKTYLILSPKNGGEHTSALLFSEINPSSERRREFFVGR
jgi:hypothetical protein